jgi:hypothetical protein
MSFAVFINDGWAQRGRRDKPTLYILHVLGDEGEESLLAYLKVSVACPAKKRWLATTLPLVSQPSIIRGT